MTDKQIKLMAELIQSLLVLRSIPGGLHRATQEAFDGLRVEFHLFGWQSAEEIADDIRRTLCKSAPSRGAG
ncbi:MAG: hypothetical protein V2A73_12460 [Pseudomonadota bacterium]